MLTGRDANSGVATGGQDVENQGTAGGETGRCAVDIAGLACGNALYVPVDNPVDGRCVKRR